MRTGGGDGTVWLTLARRKGHTEEHMVCSMLTQSPSFSSYMAARSDGGARTEQSVQTPSSKHQLWAVSATSFTSRYYFKGRRS